MDSNLFAFDIPDRLIAQKPANSRDESRLMKVDRVTGKIFHHRFTDIVALIPWNALLVFNNARVRKVRMFGTNKRDNRVCEFLFLEKYGQDVWKTIAKPMKKIRTDDTISFPENRTGCVTRREGDFIFIYFSPVIKEEYFERNGRMPLPPYIRREAVDEDATRYQTVYARESGSAAAPTAGLHFTTRLRDALAERGVEQVELTLHVGIGTFLPIRGDTIEEHVMHEETYTIAQDCADAINRARDEGRPVVAVGTTSVRALESSVDEEGRVQAGTRVTSLYITPGYQFRVVKHLLTNFHTPRSTLLVLVASFAGFDLIKAAYEEAVRKAYRFFSYGDAMLIV